MFGLKKRKERRYSDKSVIESFVQILVYRDDIIPNRVFTDKERELNGMLGFSGRKLSDELDSVAIYYAYQVFIADGRTADELDRLLAGSFDRFVKDKVIKKTDRQQLYEEIIQRVHEYLPLRGHKYVGAAFMAHVVAGHNASTSDMGRYIAPVLKTLGRNIQKVIKASLHD